MQDKDHTAVPYLEIDDAHPLTLARIVDYCTAGERLGHPVPAHYIRALIGAWTHLLGNTRQAVLDAEPDALADLIRDASWTCEGCTVALAPWSEYLADDHGDRWCGPCAFADRNTHPSRWRIAADRFEEIGA